MIYKKLADWITKEWLLILSTLFSCITFGNFLSFNIFTSSDWYYYFPKTLDEYLNLSVWVDRVNLGTADSTIWRSPLYFLIGLLNQFGLGYDVSEKLFVFWPIVFLAPAAGYYLAREFGSNRSGAFIGSLVFSFNSYFLAIITQGHLLLNEAFVFGTFGFILYARSLKKHSIKLAVAASLCTAVCGYLDVRSLYIMVVILLIYTLLNLKTKWSFWKINIVFWVQLILLNVFWIAPFIVNKGGIGSDVLQRGLFGNKFWSFRAAVTIFHPFWSGEYIEWFQIQSIPWFFWVLPLVCGFGLVRTGIEKRYRIGLFLLIISLIGILLTKQVDEPFPQLYPWLFKYFPGFKAFREASKFYFFTIFAYTVLSSISITALDNLPIKKIWKQVVSISVTWILAVVMLANIVPYTSRTVGGLIDERTVPQVYKDFNKKLESENYFYRTLWIPREPRWATNTALHPKISFSEVLSKNFNDLQKANNLKDVDYSKPEEMLKFFGYNFFEDYINTVGVKYVVVPSQDFANSDDFYKYYGKNRDAFTTKLDQISYLKRITPPNNAITIYENSHWQYSSSTHTGNTIALDNLNNLENKYNFIANTLKYDHPLITVQADEANANQIETEHTSFIMDPYSQITINNINLEKNIISSNINSSSYTKAFVSKNQRRINYELTDRTLSLTLQDSRGSFLDGVANNSIKDSKTTILKTILIDPTREYYISYNGEYTALKRGSDTIGVYTERNPIEVFSTDNQNIVSKSGFEEGSWEPQVGDCFNYDDRADIQMNINNYGANSDRSLKLSAKNHIACTQQIINIQQGQNYLFKLKYKLEKPNSVAGYNLSFSQLLDTDENKNTKESIENSNTNWNSYSRFFTNSVDNSKLEITLYADGVPEGNSVSYDDVTVIQIDNELRYRLPVVRPDFQEIVVDQTNANFEYVPFFKMRNIIQNEEFTDQLWKEQVSDCSNHDNNPQIYMNRGVEKSNPYLELVTGNHLACTSQTQTIEKNIEQLVLGMKYRTNALQMGYYVTFNDINSTTYKDFQDIKQPSTDWTPFNKIINVPNGSTKVTFGLYGIANNRLTTTTAFDSVQLIGIPRIDNSVFLTRNLVNEPNQQFENLTFDTETPDLKIKNSFIYQPNKQILLNSQFDPTWRLFINDRLVPSEFHSKTLSSTNMWAMDSSKLCTTSQICLDSGEKVTLRIEYQPQQYFRYGLVFSSFVFFSVLLYLVIPPRKNSFGKHLQTHWGHVSTSSKIDILN